LRAGNNVLHEGLGLCEALLRCGSEFFLLIQSKCKLVGVLRFESSDFLLQLDVERRRTEQLSRSAGSFDRMLGARLAVVLLQRSDLLFKFHILFLIQRGRKRWRQCDSSCRSGRRRRTPCRCFFRTHNCGLDIAETKCPRDLSRRLQKFAANRESGSAKIVHSKKQSVHNRQDSFVIVSTCTTISVLLLFAVAMGKAAPFGEMLISCL